ncbi:MAG: alpha-amylase [Chloroflexi bacterium HGW-Chloroflexi-6]|nr:MAG: alpha-amylase [Chloroflexi bacterium HGW-Chloroflexi-6]
MKRILAFILLFLFMVSCAPAQTSGPWWPDSVFYEIFVRSFNDSDGDGIGDFNGITAKLDYLQSLGVTAIWLMPINPSPSYHGYDVLDYYDVNPQYGTMDDFKRLLAEAHKRDMHVIIDLVLNHTSSQHPWFQSANSDAQSSYRNWYLWADEYVGNHWHGGQAGYYYGFFWSEMPDLNYTNPEVTAEMGKMSLFWLNEVGVDGFRIDAAKHLVEEGTKFESTPANHEWLKEYYASIKKNTTNAYLIGEIYGAGALVSKIYKNELDHIFNFEIASGAVNSANGGANSGIRSAIIFARKDNPEGNFATFLTNHDQERVMSTLRGDINKAKIASFLLLTSPGTPFLYYGEEIGMTGKKPDEYIRTPMQWDTTQNAGFSTGEPWIAVNKDYTERINVTEQENDPNSLLNHYRALIALRDEHAALRTGEAIPVETKNNAVFAMLRQNKNETLLILVNLGKSAITDYQLSLEESVLKNGTFQIQTLFGNAEAASLNIENGLFGNYQPVPELSAYQMLILKIK